MQGIKWFKNKNYYQVKNWLLARGFNPTENRGFVNNTNNKKCYCTYTNGTEDITLYYTIKPGKTLKYIADIVYKFTDLIYDNKNIEITNQLYEKIINNISKSLENILL